MIALSTLPGAGSGLFNPARHNARDGASHMKSPNDNNPHH